MLLSEPSQDGSPNIVVNGREDTLGAPRMPIEVVPASKDGIEPFQPALEGLVDGAPREDRSNGAAQAQAIRALLGNHQAGNHPSGTRTRANPQVVAQEAHRVRHRSDECHFWR